MLNSARIRTFPSDLILASSSFVLLSALSYFILLRLLGYTYDLLFLSNLAFAAIGLLMLAFNGFRGSTPFRLLYLVVVLALFEELVLNSALAWYGLALAFTGLIALPVAGVLLARKGEDTRVVLEACGLLFATRIVFSPFPVNLLQSAAILPAIYTLIMTLTVLYVWYRKVSLTKIGFSRGVVKLPLQVLAGLLVGAILGVVEYYILKPQPVRIGPDLVQNVLYLVVTMTVFVGLTEELLFRGVLQTHMHALMPRWQAVHLTSLIFSIFHIGWLNPLEVVFAYAAGVVFGYLMIRTTSLTSPVLAHGFGNIVLYTLARGL